MRSHHGCGKLWKHQTVTNRLHIFAIKSGRINIYQIRLPLLCYSIWVSINWLVITLKPLLNMLFHYMDCLGFLFNGNQRRFVKWLLGIGILNVVVAKSGVIFTIKRSYSLLVWSECRLSILCGIPTYPTCTAGGSEKALCCQFNCIHVRHTIVSIANDKI